MGFEIIVDKDTFRAGQTAPVMLFVPASDRYVLFSVEGEDLYELQAGARHRNGKAPGVADRRETCAQHLSERGQW